MKVDVFKTFIFHAHNLFCHGRFSIALKLKTVKEIYCKGASEY